MGVSRCDCWKLPYGVTLAHAQTHWRGTVVAVALRVRRSIFPDLSDRLGSQNHDRERPLITSIAVGSGHETGTDDRQVTGNSCLTSPAAALRHAVYAGNFLTSAGLRSSGFSGCRSPEGTMPKSMNGCRTGLNWTSGQRTVASTRFQPLGASYCHLPFATFQRATPGSRRTTQSLKRVSHYSLCAHCLLFGASADLAYVAPELGPPILWNNAHKTRP